MKFFSIMLSCLFLLLSGSGLADMVVCDPAPENSDSNNENDILSVVIIQDGAEIVRPYELTTDGRYVKLIDVSLIAQAQFQFMFENKQQRRSDPVDFSLFIKPQGCTGVRVIQTE